MLQVEPHPELDGLASNDYINEKYLPVPARMALTEPWTALVFPLPSYIWRRLHRSKYYSEMAAKRL